MRLVVHAVASLLVATAFVGCKGRLQNHANGTTDDAGPMPDVAAAPPLATTPRPDGGTTTRSGGASAIESLVHTWNVATNAHDAARLGTLYADRVTLYGKSVDREGAEAMKQAAFTKHKHDDLTHLRIDPARPGSPGSGRAWFDKRSTSLSGKIFEGTGYLEVVSTDGGLRIAAEGDTTTDQTLQHVAEARCARALEAAVSSTPEAQRAMAEIETGAKGAPPDEPVTVGGMTMPPEEGGHTWTVSICENHVDRMPCLYDFEVDATTGAVTMAAMDGVARPLVVPEEARRRAVDACR